MSDAMKIPADLHYTHRRQLNTTQITMQQYDQVIVDIKDYVYRYEVTSPKAWQNAKVALLDTLGCAIETVHRSADCRRLLGPWGYHSTVKYGFRLPGTSHVLDPVKGAFDMATIIRYLDHNDGIAGADWGHPSGSVSLKLEFVSDSADNLGAILAVSDWLSRATRAGEPHEGPPLTMKTLLTALIKAYEIQGCILLKNAFNSHGLDHVILVKLASTAVVAWILGLSEEQAMAAISHVWMDGQPLRVYRQAGNTIPRKGWAAGEACMKAVQIALLVQAGQPGAKTPLSVPRWGFYAISFGGKSLDLPKTYTSWVVENVLFKVMPVEGHGISSVQACLRHLETLRSRGNSPSDIESIIIRSNAATKLIIDKRRPLVNAADRDHCIQYLVSLTLLKGDIPTAEDFLDQSEWAQSSAMTDMMQRVDVMVSDEFTKDYLDLDIKSFAAGVRINLKDGTEFDEVVIHFPVGHPKNVNTAAVVRQKLIKNLSLEFDTAHTYKIIQAVDNMEICISDFVDLFSVGQRASRL